MKFGDWGEEQAARYVAKMGYEIVERNFRCKAGEIDIIARDGRVLCFVEVKARSSLTFGRPSEAITKIKRLHLLRTAQFYLLLHNITESETRIDVIEILKIGGKTYVNHIENALG